MPGVVISSAVIIDRSSKYLSKKIFNTFFALVIILFSCGSMYVVLSRHNEDFNDEALRLRDVALSINANTQPTDRILLAEGNLLMEFYADRAMKYYIGSLESFHETLIADYDYFVVYEDVDPDLLDHLVKNYGQTSRDGIIYFDLQK